MFELDVRTLLISSGLIFFGSVVALTALWRSELPRRGSGHWLIGVTLIGLGFFLVGFRHLIPNVFSILVGDLCLLLGLAALLRGKRVFVEKPHLRWVELIGVPIGFLLICYYLLIDPSEGMRSVVMSLMTGLFSGAIIVTLLAEQRAPWRRAGYSVCVFHGLLFALMIARIANVVVIHGIDNYTLLTQAGIDGGIFLLLILVIGGNTIALVLLGLSVLESDHRIFFSAVNQALSSILITDSKGNVQFVNPAYSKRTGFELPEIRQRGSNLTNWDSSFTDTRDLLHTLKREGEWRGEVLNHDRNGDPFWEIASISPVKTRSGEITNFVVIREEITALKEAEKHISHLANHDELTGLPSLRLAKEHLDSTLAFAKRNQRRAAVMFLDLDGFKTVNDTHGHAAGDELLVAVGERLRGCMREVDTLSRIGGDEFLIVLMDINLPNDPEQVAKRIQKAISQPFKLSGCVAGIGVSIGISVNPEDGSDRNELMLAADQAMYMVKRSGKNGYQFASKPEVLLAVGDS